MKTLFDKSAVVEIRQRLSVLPTHPSLVVSNERDLARERERLAGLVDRFSAAGAAGCTRHPHPFFGELTPAEWGTGMYKHLDHHLRQFGV